MNRRHPVRAVLLLCILAACSACLAAEREPLVLEEKIPLEHVSGRIDHLALDLPQRRLFVAALGNNTVEVVDLAARRVIRTLTGFDEPQGLAYLARSQTLYVANGGDGSLRIFRGTELTPLASIKLGSDADNVRVDQDGQHVYVGYGAGAIAVIDETAQAKLADIRLKAHPESFQLETSGSRIFVNVPDASEIAIIDRRTNKQTGALPTGNLHANYPMALDEKNNRVLTVFRHPATLAVFDLQTGTVLDQVATCGDADDVFNDTRRGYVYVACGEGFIDVFELRGKSYVRISRVKTISGARTALYSADLDQLFLAARATSAEPASIWIFRPSQ
jgi:DNA-binding beta-propeller fold protein YncE